jgi:hypothetical protein
MLQCWWIWYELLLTAPSTAQDTDSGEGRFNCCYRNQYSYGTNCEQCMPGVNCTLLGSSLNELTLEAGYWRASSISVDVRQCWLADACIGRSSTRVDETTSILQDDVTTYCAQGYKGPCKYTSNCILHISMMQYYGVLKAVMALSSDIYMYHTL